MFFLPTYYIVYISTLIGRFFVKRFYLMASDSKANKVSILPSLLSFLSDYGRTVLVRPILSYLLHPITLPVEEISIYNKEDAIKEYEENPIALYARIQENIETYNEKYDIVLCDGVDIESETQAFDELLSLSIPVTLGLPIIQVQSVADTRFLYAKATILARNAELQQKNISPVATIVCGFDGSEEEEKVLLTEWNKTCQGELILLKGNTLTKETADAVWNAILSYKDTVISPLGFELNVIEKAKKNKKTIVIPEGEDDRVIEATSILSKQSIASIILLGNPEKITARAKELGLFFEDVVCISPEHSEYFEDYVSTYYELRQHKGITQERAREVMKSHPYFATMMVYKGHADGMVGGALHTTADTIRPSLEFIKTKPGISVVSSAFIMNIKNSLAVFADCAVNTNPTAQQLCDIAMSSIETARSFGIEPKVAMLSYSTGTSGSGPDVTLVEEATKLLKEALPSTPIDGPIQFDAAVDTTVAKLKLPHSVVAGEANVFIFPNLSASNIGYKAVQRCANASAYGPFLQGLNKPVNDLSRGCSVNDIVITVAITALCI